MALALNPAQDAVVRHPGGPLLVLAGAGSGKTRVLTARIAHLIQERAVRPERVFAVTFTNKAAGEMRARVAALLGAGPGSGRRVRLARAGVAAGERHGLRRPAAASTHAVRPTPRPPGLLAAALRARARGRVSGHQRRAVPAREAARGGPPQPLRRGGRRPGDLRVARRRC